MKTLITAFSLVLVVLSHADTNSSESIKIAFGSCAHQERPQAIWSKIAEQNPDLFVLLGDNVYIDSADSEVMADTYQELADNPHFKAFREKTPIVGIWDDHDYGLNDGGKEFVGKHDAKNAFIHFFDYPEVQALKNRDGGIYHSKWLTKDGLAVHIVLLDTRWYRDPLTKSYLSKKQTRSLMLGPYQPNFDNSRTLLGNEQWQWLEQELKKPADVKIIASSIQVIPQYSGWELWANFPTERQRMIDLVANTSSATTILFISGDVHRAEISELKHSNQRFIELTSSGLDAKVYPAAPNVHRVGEALVDLNYGLLTITKTNHQINIAGQILDDDNQVRLAIDF